MKIFDMHVHARPDGFDPQELLHIMEQAGIDGACIISAPPEEHSIDILGGGLPFEARLEAVLNAAKDYKDRIFPILWVHPHEEDVIEKVRVAAAAGIAGFKMICSNYYVYEEASMQLLREIAALNLPVIFHTGILWDGNVSSQYNRPLNWESLLEIDGIRFSMGHCSWPWIDECIALYGKFLNARCAGKRVEMFFDITPGTPKIYRRELLTKLYTVGYNVGDNVMFGLDSMADAWKSEWARQWLKLDGEILDELGVGIAYRQKLYADNLLRFLGKTENAPEVFVPETDDAHEWSATNPTVKEIIKKWYSRLLFPKEYDRQFYDAVEQIPVSDAVNCDSYNLKCTDGKRNLLSFLFMCEAYEKECTERGIPQKVIVDTLSDIVIWCTNWSNIKDELYLGELTWLIRHLRMKLFRLGRLQFCLGRADRDIEKYRIKKGDRVLEVHIPQGEKLSIEACKASMQEAIRFFATYFPKESYTVFTCHSWMLDETLRKYLPEESGILRFGDLFDRVEADESMALLGYLFAFDTTPLNLKYRYPCTSFASRIQKAVLSGEQFYETLGVIPK